jgi:hypothetical protein
VSAPAEIWRPVVGYEGAYEVSNLGRVRSLDRLVPARTKAGTHFWKRWKGRVLCQHIGTHHYFAVVFSALGVTDTRTVHTVVAEAFIGPCPAGEEVRHRDCDNLNNRADNLLYGARSLNREDSRIAGTLAVGERIAQHKLTAAQVIEIRAASGFHHDIAERFGVSREQISRIKRRENWQHV